MVFYMDRVFHMDLRVLQKFSFCGESISHVSFWDRRIKQWYGTNELKDGMIYQQRGISENSAESELNIAIQYGRLGSSFTLGCSFGSHVAFKPLD